MEQVRYFNCKGQREKAVERMLEEVSKWLEKNSERVIQRNVLRDGEGYPIIFFFYRIGR